MFISAPILQASNPDEPFMVEVSSTELGAILSQRGQEGCLHPCAFSPQSRSSAERNYDVGDPKLLAVKLTLEEWHHWSEGSRFPFQVWMDHKNLEYLRSTRRLNPRQAKWTLFFSRFNFTLS